jgi:hypothetical protein
MNDKAFNRRMGSIRSPGSVGGAATDDWWSSSMDLSIFRILAPAGSLRSLVGRWSIAVKSPEVSPAISSHLQPISGYTD